jgi:pimeloyl-ACP methyl ester carboxylesterase
LNRSRYQPWFFYYPTGIRLTLASRLLYEALLDLKKRYGFTNICITAHSMGGLVTRHLLTRFEPAKEGIRVRLYVTMASPWSGFESADRVLRMRSKKLPSWLDIASSSAFIKRTLRAPLPPEIAYYLFYGKRDGTSQGRSLDERAFGGAREIFGFDVDHDSILIDRAVFRQYSALLERELR